VVEADFAYLAMEYVKGFSLEEHTRIDKLLPMHRVIGIIFKCADGARRAYRQGIIHRDIKPANIMVAADDEAKIADFGLALNMNKERDRLDLHHGRRLAGLHVARADQGLSAQPEDRPLLAGRRAVPVADGPPAFRANNQATLIYRIINTDAPSVTSLNPICRKASTPS
jgi:serine/threonine protein kinase